MGLPVQNPDLTPADQFIDIHEFLKRSYVFSGAPGGVAKLFAYLAKQETYAKGQIILEEGNPCDRFFLIVSGKVDIHQHHNGRRFHLQLLTGDSLNYFGELGVVV